MEKLVLHYKGSKGKEKEPYYVFSTSAKTGKKRLNYEDGAALVSQYGPKDRNCRVSSGTICWLPGMGPLGRPPESRPGHGQGFIKLYTKKAFLDAIKPCIFSNETAFIQTKQNKGFLLRYRDIMYKIDRALIADLSLLKIQTPFGIASVNDLSTGCKTALNIMNMLERAEPGIVNIDECGDNVLDLIFDAVAGTEVSLYLSHTTDKVDTSRKFMLNGYELNDDMEFLDAIWAEDEE